MAKPDINAWASGQLGEAAAPIDETAAVPTFHPDADVNVISPRGQAGTVKGANVQGALAAGYRLEDSAATHERVLQKEYGDAPILAGVLGAARGATVGGSDAILRAFGGRDYAEAASALERFNPVTSTLTELGGAVAGSFIPGLGFVNEAGHAVEGAVEGSRVVRAFSEGGQFAKAAARYAPVLARGAVEGAIYGAGGGISKSALSEDPITAEALVGDMATGAMIGAPMGAAMAAGGKFLSDSAAWARSAHSKAAADSLVPTEAEAAPAVVEATAPKKAGLPSYAEVNPDIMYKTTANELADAGLHELPGARVNEGRMNRVRGDLGKPEEFNQPIRLAMDEEGKIFVEDGRHRLGALLEEGGNRPIEVQIDRSPVGVKASGEGTVPLGWKPVEVPDHYVEDFKTKYHRATVASRQNIRQYEGLVKKGANVSPELEVAVNELEAARAKTQSMLPTEGSADASRTYEVNEKTGKQGRIAREMWTADNKGIAEAAQKPGFAEAMAEHQRALDKVQKLLGNREYPAIVEPDHPIYGKGGGGGSKNGLSTEARALAEGLGKPPTTPKASGKRMDAKAAEDLFGVKMPTEAEKVAAKPAEALAKPVKAATGHAEESGLSKLLKPVLGGHSTEMANRLIHHASTGAVHSLENAAFQLLGLGGGYSLGALAHRYVHHETGSNMLGYLAGAVAGVPLAMLMSHTIRAPLAMLMKGKLNISDLLAGRAGKAVTGLADGVDALVAGKTSGAKVTKAANAILGGVVFAVTSRPEHKKGTVFQQRQAELTETLANPMEARRKIHENLAGVRAADPMLSDQMEELAFARLMFLGEKMPKDPGAGAKLGKRAPWQPNDSEISRWARYVLAAEQPQTVLHSVASGTVTPEQVETLETLYPTTYQRVRGDIVARSAELQKTLSWEQRLSLSVLFHAPVDDILQPQSVAAMQANFLPSKPEQTSSQGSPSAGTIKPPSPTRAQSLAAGQ